MLILHQKIVITPNNSKLLDSRITNDAKYFSYFENCLGALDGTQLSAHLPAIITPKSKGMVITKCFWSMQNEFTFTFCYVLAGWERSAHDDRVLEDVLFTRDFKIPDGKYYLADAGYHNTDYLLCPYRGVRYHLKEQAAAGKKPVNKEELFNLCHSSLRNVVKRIFGVTKQRFQIFKSAPEYHYNTQISLVFAVTALHNFIHMYQSEEDIYDREQGELDEGLDDNEESVETIANLAKGDGRKMNEFCDRIATEMWQDYVQG